MVNIGGTGRGLARGQARKSGGRGHKRSVLGKLGGEGTILALEDAGEHMQIALRDAEAELL